jgi:hypothetical protein
VSDGICFVAVLLGFEEAGFQGSVTTAQAAQHKQKAGETGLKGTTAAQ